MTKYNLKYIIIGDGYVGKSSIMAKLLYNEFLAVYEMTLGVDFGIYHQKINNDDINIQIWDTVGQEKYKSVIRSYYRSSHCCLLVFDVTNKDSFNNIKEWKSSVETYSNSKPLFILIGNKIDLEKDRKVKRDEALQFAKDNDMEYFETSAKTGLNIKNIMLNTVEKIYNDINYFNLYNECEKKIVTIETKKKTNNKCCDNF